jgi:hypothetical protein
MKRKFGLRRPCASDREAQSEAATPAANARLLIGAPGATLLVEDLIANSLL